MSADKEIHDIEITMHAFRMMRDGGYKKAKALFDDIKKDFPDIPEPRLKSVLANLCRRLLEES